jgi:hypothetical protein
VPVTIEDSPKTLYMQFDLGAPSTVLKDNKARSLLERFPALTADGKKNPNRVTGFGFAVGDIVVKTSGVKVRNINEAAGIYWDDTNVVDIIGTIGSDLLDGRVVVIDYPARRIFVGDRIPDGVLTRAPMSPFSYRERRILLGDVHVDGEPTDLMFDTGSSALALLTSAGKWRKMTGDGAGSEQFQVNSWGRKVMAFVAPTQSRISFGPVVMPLETVAYTEGVSPAQQLMMSAAGVGGMTGNKLFVNRILVLDGVNKRYAVLDAPAAATPAEPLSSPNP